MKKMTISKATAMMLVLVMLLGTLPMNVLAVDYDPVGPTGDDYYKVISKKDWELAPGVNESEIILNNAQGTLRQVTHVVEIDLNNPYTKVIPGYKEMIPTPGNYGTSSVSAMAAYAEDNGYGNVVAATNTTLSWYNTAYYVNNPHLVGEPLGYVIMDGELLHTNSQGQSSGASTCIVINYNECEIDGVLTQRPDDMPRVTIRSTKDPITGWEEQVIPVSFDFLIRDIDDDGIPENVAGTKGTAAPVNHTSGFESRTFVGVKADGKLVVVVSDGRQAPYSTGFNAYEMADYMLKMGCVVAANCDGGGSTEFMSQRPGEDLKINCSLSDGGERPSTNSILVISTAPSTGEFARASLSTDYDYYTPGATVNFEALGTDLVGAKVDIPAEATWAIREEGMGNIENGVFVSNGTEGTVTAQLIYNGEVVGEHSITLATPDELSFSQPVVTIPYGKCVLIPIKATINDGLHEIGLGAGDITFTTTNPELGSFNGLYFDAVDEANVPDDITSVVTATLNADPSVTATFNLNLGRESVVMWDFEDGTLGDWKAIVQRNPNESHRDFVHDLSIATREDGQVHDGNYSMRLETNGLSSNQVHSQQYAYVRLGVPNQEIILENARALGFWLYVPEDNIQCWVQGYYRYDTNGDGTYDTLAEVNMMASENVYYNVDESGWHYLTMDLSRYEKVVLGDKWNVDPAAPTGATGDFFLAIIFHKSINNQLWQNNGSINGPYTYYIDNITVDYSDAVEDREAPVFDKIYLYGNGEIKEMKKRAVATTSSNMLDFSADVSECTERVAATGEKTPLNNYTGIDSASAKAYVDGVEVPCSYADGKISVSGIALADGYHRVKLEICDNMGNKSVKIRVLKVESGVDASTVYLTPADTTLDRLYGGSVYWMNLTATDIETIKSVTAVLDLNNVNHWELDHMELAEGFTAEYTVADETNTATVTITRTGKNTETGEAVLASLPVRIISFDTDMNIPGYTAETFWKTYNLWPHDLKMDVDMGVITYVDGYESTVAGTFSNEEFHVDTEIYTDAQSMDVSYRNERGTAHVHTPVAIDDLSPTCTKKGYTGRTYCEVCDSVVDWGTYTDVAGHSYTLTDAQFICDVCGDIYELGTGMFTINGTYYYAINGVLVSGWQNVDDKWHYFDETTYAPVPTATFTFSGKEVTYEFYEDGEVVDGVWVELEGLGTRYYYGPGYYKLLSYQGNIIFFEIDGKTYGFNGMGFRYEGICFCKESSLPTALYVFGDDGVFYGMYNGLYEGIYYEEGRLVNGKGIIEWEGDYYYINASGKIYVDGTLSVGEAKTNGLVPAGSYTFGADGKMIIKNGIVDGKYYEDGVLIEGAGVVFVDGDYYYIMANGKVYVGSISIGEAKSNGLLPSGTYVFGEDGKLDYSDTVKVEIDGLRIKLSRMYEIRDIYVASGAHTTYRDVKNNKLYGLSGTSAKIVNNKWSYKVTSDGEYTVYIRFNDGDVYCETVTLGDPDRGVLVVSGNKVTVTGIDDLYVIRYAAGEYSTSAEIKRAPGAVAVQPDSRRIVEGVYGVTLSEGTYSFVIQYNDGTFIYYQITI